MRRVPAKHTSFKQTFFRVELAQIYRLNAMAITLVVYILPQMSQGRHEKYDRFARLMAF